MLRRTTTVRGSYQLEAKPAHAAGAPWCGVLGLRRPARSRLRDSSEARGAPGMAVGVVGAAVPAPLLAPLLGPLPMVASVLVQQASRAAACCRSALPSPRTGSGAGRPPQPAAAPAPPQQQGAGGEPGGLAPVGAS